MTMKTHRTSRGAARLRILADTAADMFLDQGYEAVSMHTLITRVGGSRRNIYDHFGGKEGLFIEVVSQLCIDLARPLEELEITGQEVKPALTMFGCNILKIVAEPRTLALHRLMIAEGQRFPALAQAIWQSGQENATRILAGWIEHRQSSGELRTDLPAANLAAQFVTLTIAVPQLRSLVGLVPEPLQPAEIAQIVDQAVALFLSGALVKKGGSNA